MSEKRTSTSHDRDLVCATLHVYDIEKEALFRRWIPLGMVVFLSFTLSLVLNQITKPPKVNTYHVNENTDNENSLRNSKRYMYCVSMS